MLKAIFHYRNADSTQDMVTHLAGFFQKGLVSGGVITAITPNSVPQISISPFKLIGVDGMVAMETSSTFTMTLQANQTSVICFQSQYVVNGNPILNYVAYEIGAFNQLDSATSQTLVVFGTVTTGSPTDTPTIDYSLADVIDPVGRNSYRGVVNDVTDLPATKQRIGDAYLVESGISDPDNGIYVWKGSSQGWVNISDALTVANLLTQHRSNLFANEIHMTDAEADAALGSYGSPSSSNKYVTSLDPRIPSQSENDALVGLSQVTPIAPSSSNPYVTSAYLLAEPASVTLTASGGYLVLSPSGGPYYVGVGANASSAIPYFGVFDATFDRGYVNAEGQPIAITGVYKDLIGPTPLNPASEPTIVADNGFWSGSIYLSYSGTIDTNVRVRFGVGNNLSTIARGFPLEVGPHAAQTSAEALARMQAISGRLFDDPIQTGESNTALHQTQISQGLYLNATTTADMVVPCSDFPHLRQTAGIAADFPLVLGNLIELGANSATANYTVGYSNAAVSAFDTSFTEDIPNLAVITYAVGTTMPAVQPGWTWVDDLGNTYRILAYNGTYGLLIYTGGATVNVNNAAGNQSQIWRSNNPRQLEISCDHMSSMYREFIPIEGIAFTPGYFEELPPGGVFAGSYIPANNYSQIGTGVLPNQGNASGSPRGRPYFSVLPTATGNRVDTRLVLIGDWASDQINYPLQAVGNISAGGIGIEFTGRFSEFILYTSFSAASAYGYRVFIDGVYNNLASKNLTSNNSSSGLTPSNVISNLRGLERQLQPIHFNNLGISDSNIHTIRVEVTQAGTKYFPLYGVEAFYNGAYESQGRAFAAINFIATNTDNAIVSPEPNSARGQHVVRYIDRTTQVRTTANSSLPIIYSLTVGATSVTTTIADANLSSACLIGDILLFTDRSTTVSEAVNFVYRRVIAVDRLTGSITINAALGFTLSSSSSRVELIYRIPCAPNGTPVCGSPKIGNNPYSNEYARLSMADWSVGMSRDVSNLGNTSPDSRVTVLDDGSTSLAVYNCRKVTSGIAGYSDGIRFETTSATMVWNMWGTRADVVFTGSGGSAATIQIEIDGAFSYTITVPNNGYIHHTLFHSASPQSHTVKISNPSVAAEIVVSQWIFFDVAAPAYNGTALYEFVAPRNCTAAVNSNYYDFSPTSSTNPNIVSPAGLRIFDISKYGAKYYEGTGGTYNWTATQDFVNSSRYGYIVNTDRTDAFVDIQVLGSHAEIYYLAGPDHGIAQVYIDGIVASSTNYNGLVYGPGYVAGSGQLDQYNASQNTPQRLVITGLAFGYHVIRIQNTGSKNISSSSTIIDLVAAAENPGPNMCLHRSLDDSADNRFHMSAFRDLRQFLTLTPSQVGVVASNGAGSGTGNGLTLGYINGAFAMSDGSGVAYNCALSVVTSVTVVDLTFPWVQGVNPGSPVGDLEVIVDGQILPRKVAGTTQDAWYTEDPSVATRINLWANLSGVTVSIDIRRKAGTIDSSTANTGRLQVLSGVILGTSTQVTSGIADASTWAAAIGLVATGGKITVLPGFTSTENVILTKRISIEGAGYDCACVGTFSLSAAVAYATIKSIYATQFILASGASGNQILDCFWDTNPIDPNSTGTNRITGMHT